MTTLYEAARYKKENITAKYIVVRADGAIVLHEVAADGYTYLTRTLDLGVGGEDAYISDEQLNRAYDSKNECFNQVLVWGSPYKFGV